MLRRLPVPGKQARRPASRHIRKPGENIGEPCLWVDVKARSIGILVHGVICLAVAAAGWVGVSSPGDCAALESPPTSRHDPAAHAGCLLWIVTSEPMRQIRSRPVTSDCITPMPAFRAASRRARRSGPPKSTGTVKAARARSCAGAQPRAMDSAFKRRRISATASAGSTGPPSTKMGPSRPSDIFGERAKPGGGPSSVMFLFRRASRPKTMSAPQNQMTDGCAEAPYRRGTERIGLRCAGGRGRQRGGGGFHHHR